MVLYSCFDAQIGYFICCLHMNTVLFYEALTIIDLLICHYTDSNIPSLKLEIN